MYPQDVHAVAVVYKIEIEGMVFDEMVMTCTNQRDGRRFGQADPSGPRRTGSSVNIMTVGCTTNPRQCPECRLQSSGQVAPRRPGASSWLLTRSTDSSCLRGVDAQPGAFSVGIRHATVRTFARPSPSEFGPYRVGIGAHSSTIPVVSRHDR